MLLSFFVVLALSASVPNFGSTPSYNENISEPIHEVLSSHHEKSQNYDTWDNNILRRYRYEHDISIVKINDYNGWVSLQEMYYPVSLFSSASFTFSSTNQKTQSYSVATAIENSIKFENSASLDGDTSPIELSSTVTNELSTSLQTSFTYENSRIVTSSYTADATNNPANYGVYNMIFGSFGGSVVQYNIVGHRYRQSMHNTWGNVYLDNTYVYNKTSTVSISLDTSKYGLSIVKFDSWNEYYNWFNSYPFMNSYKEI